jgi:hypothetical protein
MDDMEKRKMTVVGQARPVTKHVISDGRVSSASFSCSTPPPLSKARVLSPRRRLSPPYRHRA